MWQQIVDSITAFFDKPVPIIGCTVGFLLITVLTIISKTSFGKKSIVKLTELSRLTIDKVEKTKAEVDATLNQIEQAQTSIEENLTRRLEEQDQYIEKLENLITEIGATIRNSKIRALINEYKQDKQTNEQEKEVSENGEK